MKKLLIIDDDTVVTRIYRNTFTVEGFKVECAKDSESGLRALQEFAPDILLLDLMFPTMDGIELLKQIRSNPSTATLPTVVLSNCYQPSLMENARKAGATECLRKSECTPRMVAEAVARVLSTSSSSPAPVSHREDNGAASQKSVERLLRVEDLQRDFISQSTTAVSSFRHLLQSWIKAESQTKKLDSLHQIQSGLTSLIGTAAVCGYSQIAQLACSLQALSEELLTRPKRITPSTNRTLTQGFDFLNHFIGHCAAAPSAGFGLPANILVVDDEPISRKMVHDALQTAELNSIQLESSAMALEVLKLNRFDLIFLDVSMPDMDGFNLCERIREQPHNGQSPVVFVTGLSDFDTRTRSTLSGGTDFIAKPFVKAELALKALIHLLQQKAQEKVQASLAA